MRDLHRKALVRAYRTLAQGLYASIALNTANFVADFTSNKLFFLTTLLTVSLTALGSFFHAIMTGLPETEDKKQ